MKRNAKIAELILRAQNASDGGKHKSSYNTSSIKAYTDNYAGYKHKDLCIYNAIQLILTGNSKFKFSVQEDKQKIAYFLVYFEVTFNGEKHQVSFHSYDGRLRKYISKRSFRMKWTGLRDSPKQAALIYRYFVPDGEYLD